MGSPYHDIMLHGLSGRAAGERYGGKEKRGDGEGGERENQERKQRAMGIHRCVTQAVQNLGDIKKESPCSAQKKGDISPHKARGG